MKLGHFIFLSVFASTLFGCRDTHSEDKEMEGTYSACEIFSNKQFLHRLANDIISQKGNERIWNLSEVDTSDVLMVDGHFVGLEIDGCLILMGGSAGLSAGNADNLLLLFSCADTFQLVWAGQAGEFDGSDVVDIDGNGVKEIVISSSYTWMGGCNDRYRIVSFKGGKYTEIFSRESHSVIDCGMEDIGSVYKIGDTLEHQFDCVLIRDDNEKYKVRQVEITKIHNGGITEKDIFANMIVRTDTVKIEMK